MDAVRLRAADTREAPAFDRIRSRFIQEVAKHMDRGSDIAAAVEQPDHLFKKLMDLIVVADRESKPQHRASTADSIAPPVAGRNAADATDHEPTPSPDASG